MSTLGPDEHVSNDQPRRGTVHWASTVWRAPYVLLSLASLFWAGNFIVGRAMTGFVPPIALAFWRWTLALVLALLFGFRHIRDDLPRLIVAWPIMLVLAALGIAAYNTLIYLGLQTTTALNALLLQSAMPVAIIAATFLMFGERPGLRQTAGVVVSLAGVIVIAARGDWTVLASLTLNTGDLWVLAAVAAYALYSALLRRRPAVRPLSFLAATFALGSLMLLPLYVREHVLTAQVQPVIPAYLAITYVAALPGFLAYLFYNRGVELAGANTAGHFLHLMPIFGSGLAIALLGESLAGFHVVGALLIAAGLAMATVYRR